MIAWPVGVNKIIRSETTWSGRKGIINDTMRSGKVKSRLISSRSPKPLSVTMIFTREEYALFETWFEQSLRMGSQTFEFPKVGGTGNAEYRINDGYNASQFGSNTVKITMAWSEQ